MKVAYSIEVQYQSTNVAKVAKAWLNNLPNMFAADFETAIRYTKQEVEDDLPF